MKDAIRKMYERNKKFPIHLIALVALGVVALLLTRLASEPEREPPESVYTADYVHDMDATAVLPDFLHERAMEQRLEEFFSLVEGAGQVRVMVSPMAGRETIFAVDVNESRSYSNEEDAQGGSRETHQQTKQQQTVMVTDRAGTDRPLVLREIEPRIEGVVIIAEGGDDAFVRDALTRAAMAVLGADAHRIQVLAMATE